MSQGQRTDIVRRVHGASGYRRGCRCDLCRKGHREANRRRYVPVLNPNGRAGRKVRPPWNAVPVDRIWPILEQWMHDNKNPRFWGDEDGGASALARAVGCDPRAISKIRERNWIKFEKADRILMAIGRPDLWHSELSDLYEREREAA